MNRLIFFDGVDHTLTQFTEELVKAAQARGIPYLLLHTEEGREALIRRIGAFAMEGPCAAVIFNNIYLPLPGDDCSLWERLKIPVYNILMDHPRNYAKYLDKPLPTMHVLTVDRRHDLFIRKYYPNVRKTVFLPHGGTVPAKDPFGSKPFPERQIDVLLLSGQLPEPTWPAITFMTDGRHDRIYSGMLHGAVCVTDPSIFLKEHYTHGRDILFYELTELSSLPEQIRWLLDHPSEAEGIARAGQEKAAREDTWENRLDALLDMMTGDE